MRLSFAFGAVLVFSTFSLTAQAGGPPSGVSEEISIEEILNLQVTTVGRKAQQVANAPAAVYVITQEDIRRSGASSIPDLLRIVPGITVARINAYTWAISARGGTRQYSNKMQVMIDGRTLYNRLFAGVYWDTQDLLIEDIDRIEVIRGAGAVNWGSNAVNGVIHIITKAAKDTQGSQTVVSGGIEDRLQSSFRYGGKVGNHLFYRIWVKERSRQFYAPGSSLIRRNLAGGSGNLSFTNDGFNDNQGGDTFRAGFRIDWQKSERDLIEAQGMVFRNDIRVESFSFNPIASSQRVRITDEARGGNLQLRLVRSNADRSETSMQIWADQSSRAGGVYSVEAGVIDFDLGHRRSLSANHEVHVGLGTRLSSDNLIGGNAFRFKQNSRTDYLSNLTLRDEWRWFSQRISLSSGVRAEHNTYTGIEIQPSIKLLFAPNRTHSFWAGWSRAIRTPSRVEHDAASFLLGQTSAFGSPVLVDYQGNPSFAAERASEFAGGYRMQHRQRLSLDLSWFHTRYDRLASLEPASLGILFLPKPVLRQVVYPGNGLIGINQGLEIEGSLRLNQSWKLNGSYSYLSQSATVRPGSGDRSGGFGSTDPNQQLKLRSMWNVSRRWQIDLSGYAVDRIEALQVSGYLRVDSRIGFRPNRMQDFSFIVQDWLDKRRIEYPSELFGYSVPVRRVLQIRWTVRF